MFEKGKIILVPFPFTDLSSSKVRPGLIISNKLIGNDVVVAFISSKSKDKMLLTDVLIKETIKDYKKTGLKVDSIVKVNKIATLDKKIILGELGCIPNKVQEQVSKKLKILFIDV